MRFHPALWALTFFCALGCEVADVTLAPEAADASVRDGSVPDAPETAVDAAADARSVTAFGFPDEFSMSANLNPGIDLARKVTIPGTGNRDIASIAVITKAVSTAQVKMALYTDQAGEPGQRAITVAARDLSGEVAGPQRFSAEGISLAPGDYWIAVSTNLALPLGQDNASVSENCTVSRMFVDSMPLDFAASPTCNTVAAINLFIEVFE